MIIKLLLTTRFLILDRDFIFLPEISISQNKQYKVDNFFDEIGTKELGTHLVFNSLQKYAYGAINWDITDITNEMTYEQKVMEINDYLVLINTYFNNLLFYFWFSKDNSVSVDYIYSRTVPATNPSMNLLSNNYLTFYTCECNQIESVFSEMEIIYAHKIHTLCKNICPTYQDVSLLHKTTEGDLTNPTKSFINAEIKYHSLNRLEKALLFLSSARMESHLLSKIAGYCSLLECLFSIDKSDITYKISQRIALYIGNDYQERIYIKGLIVEAYNIRSRYIHGNAISKNDLKPKGDFHESNLIRVSKEIDNTVRVILTKIVYGDHVIFNSDEKLTPFFDTLIFS